MLNSKSIGHKIAAARKNINLSQAELAQQISISAQAVGKWERGESMPDITTLNRLAEIVGVDLNYFSERYHSVGLESTPLVPLTSNSSAEPLPYQQKRSWDMSQGNWVDADFSGLKNLQEKFGYANLKNCKFVGAHMAGLVLKANHVDTCDFSNADISHSKLEGSQLVHNLFTDCSLRDIHFSTCHIKNCNFRGADCTGASIVDSTFGSNKVDGAVLHSVSFHRTDIANIIFEGALTDCSFEHCSFSKVTFKNATIKNTFFKCKTLKHITFVDCHADKMTYEFLKNGKANLTGIALME